MEDMKNGFVWVGDGSSKFIKETIVSKRFIFCTMTVFYDFLEINWISTGMAE